MIDNIPSEMRSYQQWVVWRYEENDRGKRVKVPYNPYSGTRASTVDSQSWSLFSDCYAAYHDTGFYSGLGFVLTDNDPYTIIDLDDAKGDPALSHLQSTIYQAFDTYSERSPSGRGLHIVMRGKVPKNVRKVGVEIYSREQYMTMTGDVYWSRPISHCGVTLNDLWRYLTSCPQGVGDSAHGQGNEAGSGAQSGYGPPYSSGASAGLVTLPEEHDHAICDRAAMAVNGAKFISLYQGAWQSFYPSQSEADYALLDIIAYYSQSREQVLRIFRSSALGQRPKADRASYVNAMLRKVFDNRPPLIDTSKIVKPAHEDSSARDKDDVATPVMEYVGPVDDYAFPKGLMKDIGDFVYRQSARQVVEISNAAAIGLMAGICGRSYNISNTGTNVYLMLLAATGTGKDAMGSGISKLMGRVQRNIPDAQHFVGPGEVASAPALMRYLIKRPSFVSLFGEIGLLFKSMNGAPSTATHTNMIRRSFLKLYSMSGVDMVMHESIYADIDKNIREMKAPSLTILGESTPSTFYESMSESLVSEGLMPRFITKSYEGPRVPLNLAHGKVIADDELVYNLTHICHHSIMLNSQNRAVHVRQDEHAQSILLKFGNECDKRINDLTADNKREMWNRAHLNALKLSALASIGRNYQSPTIDAYDAHWAIRLVRSSVEMVLQRFDDGEIGEPNDDSQRRIVEKAMRDYLSKSYDDIVKTAGISRELFERGVIPYKYIHRMVIKKSAFTKDRNGSTTALKRALTVLADGGDIVEIPPQQFGLRSKLYALIK